MFKQPRMRGAATVVAAAGAALGIAALSSLPPQARSGEVELRPLAASQASGEVSAAPLAAAAREGREPAAATVTLIARSSRGDTEMVGYRSRAGQVCLGIIQAPGAQASCPDELNGPPTSSLFVNALKLSGENVVGGEYIYGIVPARAVSLVIEGDEQSEVPLIDGAGPVSGRKFFFAEASAFQAGGVRLVVKDRNGVTLTERTVGGTPPR